MYWTGRMLMMREPASTSPCYTVLMPNNTLVTEAGGGKRTFDEVTWPTHIRGILVRSAEAQEVEVDKLPGICRAPGATIGLVTSLSSQDHKISEILLER